MKILWERTDNGKAFADRCKCSPTAQHESEMLCIQHGLATPVRPTTSSMVERFSGWIQEVLGTHRFQNKEAAEQTIHHCYNQLPRSVLKTRMPINALKERYRRLRPELFGKQIYNHAGFDVQCLPTIENAHAIPFAGVTVFVLVALSLQNTSWMGLNQVWAAISLLNVPDDTRTIR